MRGLYIVMDECSSLINLWVIDALMILLFISGPICNLHLTIALIFSNALYAWDDMVSGLDRQSPLSNHSSAIISQYELSLIRSKIDSDTHELIDLALRPFSIKHCKIDLCISLGILTAILFFFWSSGGRNILVI